MTAVVAVADARGVYGDDGHRSIKGWMRANANWSGAEVTQTRRVVELFESCPSVGDALLAGHIGCAQVTELARARSNPRCGAQLRPRARPAARQRRAPLVRGLPHRRATVGTPRRRGRHARRCRGESHQPHRRAARGQRLSRPARQRRAAARHRGDARDLRAFRRSGVPRRRRRPYRDARPRRARVTAAADRRTTSLRRVDEDLRDGCVDARRCSCT